MEERANISSKEEGDNYNADGSKDMAELHDENDNDGPSPSNSNSSGNGSSTSRCCCCDSTSSSCSCSCSPWRALIVVIHIIILATAILCMIPIGVMTSVIRSYMSGIITFLWLVYCCVMVTCNIILNCSVLYQNCNGNGASADADLDITDNIEQNNRSYYRSRVSVACNKMGCMCCGSADEPSASLSASEDHNNPSLSSSRFKVACPMIVILLLIVEGILLLTPVLASISSYKSLNDGAIIDDVFPDASSLAVDPKSTAFSFGRYMLPGSFSKFGGYDNNNAGNAKTFKYKDGCKPECELDIHLPNNSNADGGVTMPSSGYPVIFHVHGGGWDSGDKSSPLIPISYWLDRGYAFVSIQYRFPSQTPGGATVFEQLDDVQDAFDYLLLASNTGAGEGLDTSNVLFFGDSAGGHLACTVAYRSGAPEIRGVMNLYGATEWEFYMDGGGGSLEGLFDKVLPNDSSEDDYRAASCSTYATSSSAPILTVHGTWDTLVPIGVSEHLHSVVGTLGVSNLLVEAPLAEHVLEAGFYSIGGQMSLYAMERFVAARLL